MKFASLVLLLVFISCMSKAFAAYKPVKPRTDLAPGETAVTAPGSFAEAGKTYVLMNDISSPVSAVFLGKDVTLDLNGHTITYADGPYEHVPNMSFEDGMTGWDVSAAPGAKSVDMHMIHPLVGDKVCVLPEGQEIVSPYINLPVPNRSYYAMVAVATMEMRVDVRVENADGKPVELKYSWDNEVRDCCPILNEPPRMGGGVVFALIYGQPAGRYRVRVKAAKGECIIDEVDIRPAMDVGVGIVQEALPWGYFKALYDGNQPAFFDYTRPHAGGPIAGIPVVSNGGKVTIRNGVIRGGTKGILSWGVLSTARRTRTVVENVKFQASGINTNGVRAALVDLTGCRFEIDTPWIINRHSQEYVATIPGSAASHITDCEFIGGQGNLYIRGRGSEVRGNLFQNDERVTNHYCMGGGDGLKVHDNRFEPKRGSGFYIGGQGTDCYDNVFKISSSPPTNEYGQEDYSCNAIRLSDYDRPLGSSDGCYNNRVHGNRMEIACQDYPGASPKYRPVANAFFVSVGGGQNWIYDNDITLVHEDPHSTTATLNAFYIGGSSMGGEYHDNKVTSNVSPMWIGCPYGKADNVFIYDCTFVRAEGAEDFPTARLGYYRSVATDVEFCSIKTVNTDFHLEIGDSSRLSSAFVGWTLTVKAAAGAEVTVLDKDGKTVFSGKGDDSGAYVARLADYRITAEGKTPCGAYTVKVGDKQKTVEMTADQTIAMD
jgi:hypothetical protein